MDLLESHLHRMIEMSPVSSPDQESKEVAEKGAQEIVPKVGVEILIGKDCGCEGVGVGLEETGVVLGMA
jgi:hypothetical protein